MSEKKSDLTSEDTQRNMPTQRMATTKPDEKERENPPQKRPRRQWPFGYLLLWFLVAISLMLNAVMMRQLLLARQTAQTAVANAITMLDSLEDQTISYTVIIDESLPLETSLPVNESIPVDIEDELEVDTIINVPITVLGQQIPIELPIETTIPVDIQQDVVIDQDFAIQTSVPVYIEIPIQIAIADTPLRDTLDNVQAQLVGMQDELNEPLIPNPLERFGQ